MMMHKPSYWLYTFPLFIVLLLLFNIFADVQADQKAPPKTLIAVIPSDSPPTYYRDSKTNGAVGFTVDVMNAIGKQAGYFISYEFKNDWDEVLDALKNGTADIAPSMGITEERKKVLSFTLPIDTVPVSFFVRADSKVSKIHDGIDVGVIKGSAAYEQIRQQYDGINLTTYEGFQHGLLDLLAGHIDAFCCPAPTFIALARNAGIENHIKTLGPPLMELKRAIALRKDDKELLSELNRAVDGFVNTSEYQQIYIKWYGKPEPYWTVNRILIFSASLAIIIIVVMGFWRYFSIRNLNRELLKTINERKQAEETVKKKEDSFRNLIDRNPIAMAVADKRGKFIFFNNKFKEIFGYNAEDIPTVDDWWPRAYPDEEYRQKVINGWKTAARKAIKDGRQTEPQEWSVTCKDGSVRDIEFRMSSTEDLNVIIFNDITESKQTKKRMESTNELLENIIEFLPDATFIIDKDKRIIAWNRSIEDMTGVPKKDILGKDHYYASVPFYGEPRPYLIDLIEVDNKELALKYVYVKRKMDVLYSESFAQALNNGKGAYIWATAGPLLDAGGNMIGAIESVRDISDRKSAEDAIRASEEKYRTLFEESKDVVFISTLEGRLLDINQAGVELFGYSSKEEMLAVDITSDLYFNSEDRIIYQKMLYEKGFVKDYEIHMKRKDGKKLIILSTSSVVRDEQGDIKAYRGILRDITEHKNLEQQLRHAQKMESIGILAGGVAHDFNNILSAIIGYGYMAQTMLKGDITTQGYIQEMLDAANRAAELTRGLLAFSRKQVINPVLIDLNEIVSNVGKMLKRIIGEDIALGTVLSTRELPVMVDAGQMEQVLMNLVTNARDAMPDGGLLTIQTDMVYVDSHYAEAHFSQNAYTYAVLKVSDTGLGMDQVTKENIFEPFFTTKEVGKGTGLGLSMVYGIVKQHNGNVRVYSEVERGTTFKIYLPLVQTEKEIIPMPIETLPEGKGETILIAEDEPQVRGSMRLILQEHGYKIIEAENGEDAVRRFQKNRDAVTLILLDVIMPVKNGREAYAEMNGIKPGVRTIFMSGYTDDIISKKGILEEGFQLISKPINPDTLMRKIREVLDR